MKKFFIIIFAIFSIGILSRCKTSSAYTSNITHFDECTITTKDSSTYHEFKAYLTPVETTN
jgi:hypothetical protein